MDVWEILLKEEEIEEGKKRKIEKFIKENKFNLNDESFIFASLIKEAKKLNDKEFDLYLKIHKKRKYREKMKYKL